MITLTTEQAQQIEVELKYARNVCAGNNWSTEGPDEAIAMLNKVKLQEQAEQEPIGYQYLFSSPFGGDVWRDSSNQWNGNKPKASRAIYAAPVEPVKQEPVALEEIRRIVAEYIEPNSQVDSGNLFWALCGALQYIDANLKFNVPTHPIRTKDLTDGELTAIWERNAGDWLACFRAVIAADREKNRG